MSLALRYGDMLLASKGEKLMCMTSFYV